MRIPDIFTQFCSVPPCRYHDNPFHCFEHASHVTMSIVKLLSRIIAPADVHEESDEQAAAQDSKTVQTRHASNLHDHIYGITSDPLTQFAVIFSVLIHDVDHQGVPNSTLVSEKAPVAILYSNKSVAEQNSFDLAWELLMNDSFADLRSVIYATEDEASRFRQIVINTVLATDIMDVGFTVSRNARWDRAFNSTSVDRNVQDAVNRKATIVIEYLIQASDIAHTMQHRHIFRRWNARLFEELHRAHKKGRFAKNPAVFWYEGEPDFFDFYVVPLARKLKECGVFGVNGYEYLDCALENRRWWEANGREFVAELSEQISKQEG
jgi:hypothetical protein